MITEIKHLTTVELEAGLDYIKQSPLDDAELKMIVRRPEIGAREVLETGELDLQLGLLGDNWSTRGSSKAPDRSAHPEMQINIMNARIIELIAGSKDRWPLAGDQVKKI